MYVPIIFLHLLCIILEFKCWFLNFSRIFIRVHFERNNSWIWRKWRRRWEWRWRWWRGKKSIFNQFDPFWSFFILFYPFFIHFDPFWSFLILFYPFLSIFIQFDLIQSILNHFDLFWSNSIQFDPIWSNLTQYFHFFPQTLAQQDDESNLLDMDIVPAKPIIHRETSDLAEEYSKFFIEYSNPEVCTYW